MICQLLLGLAASVANTAFPQEGAVAPSVETVVVDCGKHAVPRSKLATFCVGSDRAKIFLRDEHQRDLLDLQSKIGFRYLRCHGIFNEEMKIVTRGPDGSLAFDWTRVDSYIDQLRKAHLKPFVELGFMPEPLASGTQTIFWWRGNVTPPKNQDEWARLITAFLEHQIARVGRSEVRKWFFEVWNEPNLDGFWTGGQAGYFRLYATSAHAIKSVDSKLRVGGPSTAGMGWIPEFLAYCHANACPVDFVSSHSYGSTEGFLDEHGHTRTVLDTHPDSLKSEFRKARNDIDSSPFPKLPVYISEWGPSYSPRDDIHDSYVCAPFILEKLRVNEGVLDGMSYWAFSDQFEEPGPPKEPFHGGFGLMNLDGLHKPAFLVYQFLAQLKSDEVPSDDPSLIVTRRHQDLFILHWNYTPLKQDAPDSPFFHRDLVPSPLPDYLLNLKGLSPGEYRVSRVGIGYRRNDLYDAYLSLGSPKGQDGHLPSDVLKTLRSETAAAPESLPDLTVNETGTAVIRLPMRTNDVWFLAIHRK